MIWRCLLCAKQNEVHTQKEALPVPSAPCSVSSGAQVQHHLTLTESGIGARMEERGGCMREGGEAERGNRRGRREKIGKDRKAGGRMDDKGEGPALRTMTPEQTRKKGQGPHLRAEPLLRGASLETRRTLSFPPTCEDTCRVFPSVLPIRKHHRSP